MRTAITKAARAAASVGRTAGSEKAMDVGYTNPAPNASSEQMVVEKQLGWTLQALRNARSRPAERRCLLLLAGEILLGFLAQDHLESSV